MEFVDTHTHISDDAFAGEVEAVVRRALDAGVVQMLQADTCSAERTAMYELCDAYPGVLYPMLGLYPGNVDEHWRDELDAMLPYRSRGPVAIGEIGLDYHYGADTAALQKEAFKAQLELARDWDLPVNIHLRDATEDFFSIMEECRGMHLRGNLHAFSGSAEVFERVQKYGEWYVGIGGVLTFKKARIATDILRIPLERILHIWRRPHCGAPVTKAPTYPVSQPSWPRSRELTCRRLHRSLPLTPVNFSQYEPKAIIGAPNLHRRHHRHEGRPCKPGSPSLRLQRSYGRGAGAAQIRPAHRLLYLRPADRFVRRGAGDVAGARLPYP